MSGPARVFADWLDHRLGWRGVRARLLDEPLPPGTGWWFTLGSLLLFGVAVQVSTGIGLALFYAPTPDHAWDSVRYLSTEVRGGAWLRGLHHWGASLVVVAAVLHLCRVVFFGSYRKPRELNWLVGLILLQLILALALTGYLLPWDQRAYWATVVTINISALTPVAGQWIATVLRGGPEIGALTLTRWYAAHVVLLPAGVAALTVVHLLLMRRHGISGPVRERPGTSQPFFPSQMGRDLVVSLVAAMVLAGLAWRWAPMLEPPADPASSDYVPRPEWYFLGLFQLLKYFPGRLEVIGALVIPGAVMLWLALLPWIDRGRTRQPADRRLVIGMFGLGLLAAGALTGFGARDRPPVHAAWTIREIGGARIVATSDRCVGCHKDGGPAGPVVAGRIRRTESWIGSHVRDPEIIAPGIRPAPEVNEAETASILAALTRMRSGMPPHTEAETLAVYVTLARYCFECHVIDGTGGDEGPDLSKAGEKHSAREIAERLVDPLAGDKDAAMPAFGDKLTKDERDAVAAWLAARR